MIRLRNDSEAGELKGGRHTAGDAHEPDRGGAGAADLRNSRDHIVNLHDGRTLVPD